MERPQEYKMKILEEIYTENILYPSTNSSFEERWESMVQSIADLYFNLPFINESDSARNASRQLQAEIEPAVSLIDAFQKYPKINIRNSSLKEKIIKIQSLFNIISLNIVNLSHYLIEQKDQSKLDLLEKIESILYTPAVAFDRVFFKSIK